MGRTCRRPPTRAQCQSVIPLFHNAGLISAAQAKQWHVGLRPGYALTELEAADVRFVDGTFYTPDELLAMRPGAPDAYAMGHQPIGGPDGSLAALAKLPGRSIYIHINNTNPILDAASPETAEVRSKGVEIAFDGMELEI